MSRIERIRTSLESALQTQVVEIEDESHLHAGHAGAATGRGHFRVRIVSTVFAGLPLVQRHRRVYESLGELMQTDIHALSIRAQTPEEAAAVTAG